MTPDNIRLRPEFMERFKANPRLWPSSTQFRKFFYNPRRYKGQPVRMYPLLQAGKPVPRVIGGAFVEYVQKVYGWDDVTEETAFYSAPDYPSPGIFRYPELTLRSLTDRFRDRDQMYLNNPVKDSLLAARMIMDTLGYKTAAEGDSLDEESCIKRAELQMDRTKEEYARWLREISRGEGLFRTVMFFLRKGERIGVSVALPLKEERWLALAAGEISDKEIKAEDLDPRSRFVFANAMSDAERIEISPKEKSKAQAHCVFYQGAYFTRRIQPFRPASVTIVSNEYYVTVLHRFGYRKNGVHLKGTTCPIVILRHPKESGCKYGRNGTQYDIFRLLLKIFKVSNRRLWRKEDRDLGVQ